MPVGASVSLAIMKAPEFDPDTWYLDLAAASVRGALGLSGDDSLSICRKGVARGLRLQRFKRNAELPRVRRVLGALAGLGPHDLLDLGSGRGTFLWSLLDRFPWLPVTSMDFSVERARQLGWVARGGVERLRAFRGDMTSLPLEEDACDVVTALEVLEHLERPERAAAEIVRVARRFAIVTVPSKPDDNPEHIQLFTARSLEALFRDAGARDVKIDGVPGHFFALVTTGAPR